MLTNRLGPAAKHALPSLGRDGWGAGSYSCTILGFNKVINHANEAALFIPDTIEMPLNECRRE